MKVKVGYVKIKKADNTLATKGTTGSWWGYARSPKHIIYKYKKVAENSCRKDEIVAECFVEIGEESNV